MNQSDPWLTRQLDRIGVALQRINEKLAAWREAYEEHKLDRELAKLRYLTPARWQCCRSGTAQKEFSPILIHAAAISWLERRHPQVVIDHVDYVNRIIFYSHD